MCYCRNDTPCQTCLDKFHVERMAEEFNKAVEDYAAEVVQRVEDDRNWTPDDEDDMEHTRKILDDMVEEGKSNPDMANALLSLYPDESFEDADLAALRKMDAKWQDIPCPCASCTEESKWYNN